MGTPARVVVLPKEQAPLRVEEITLPDPGPNQVVIKQFSSGICHSQLHQIHRPRRSPVILGHESTGVVLKKGSDVTHVKEGDIVLVTWVPRDPLNASAPPERAMLEVSDGMAISGEKVFTWADHTIADQQFVVKADPDIKKDVTCIIGCAVMTGAGAAIHTAKVQPGESVAIFGVGGVGLSTVVGAKMAGAGMIIAVDLSDEKLEFAKKFGATHCINAGQTDPIKEIHQLTQKQGQFTFMDQPVSGVDYAFDCIGVQKTMEQIPQACRSGHFGANVGGTAVLVGVPTGQLQLSAIDMLLNEKKFIGSFAGSCTPDRDFPMFLKWHADGDLDLDALITARYKIDQINEATTALDNGEIQGRAILEFD